MKFTKGNIDLDYFWYRGFWVPDPLPPPLSSNICPCLDHVLTMKQRTSRERSFLLA